MLVYAYDFFGAYDVDEDRGVVQVADRYKLSGKKPGPGGIGTLVLSARKI